MPSKLRSGGTFPYVLKEDRGAHQDAVFQLRVLSCDENEKLLELRNDYVSAKVGRSEVVAQMLDLAVESYEVKHSKTMELTQLLTDMECWELIAACIEGATLTGDERKKFVSRPESETG